MRRERDRNHPVGRAGRLLAVETTGERVAAAMPAALSVAARTADGGRRAVPTVRIDELLDPRNLSDMEMHCADCGCLVDHGVRLIPCDTSECCCVDLPIAEPMETIAARVRNALNARDMDAFRALIAEDARWGDGGPDDARTCRNRNDIIATYKRLLDQGVRGTVTETTTGPGGVACLVEIEWPENAPNPRGPTLYQVFLVTDGLVTRIQGHDDRDLALAAISH